MTDLFNFIRVIGGFLLSLFYMILVIFSYQSAQSTPNEWDFSDFIRHVIFIPGLIPLIFWLSFLFVSHNKLKLLFLATAITLLHALVFAASAHSDGINYWLLQIIELIAIIPLMRIVRK